MVVPCFGEDRVVGSNFAGIRSGKGVRLWNRDRSEVNPDVTAVSIWRTTH
jgi:hypothetical protein